jgi:hypothetical protein
MKNLVLAFLLIISYYSYSQETNIDLSAIKSECEIDILNLNSEFEQLLKSINELTLKGDSTSLKTALDIVNNTFKSKVGEYKIIKESCLSKITKKVNDELGLIRTNIFNLEKRIEEKLIQLNDCNLRNNNEVANSLLRELKELFKNLEEKQTLIINQQAVIKKIKEDSVVITKLYSNLLIDTINLNKQIFTLKKDLEKKDAIIEVYKEKKSLFDVGLAFGPNFDSKGDYVYLVNEDSTIQENQVGIGANGMVSAVVSFEFKLAFLEKASQRAFKWSESTKENRFLPGTCKMLINIPLTETLFQDKENAIGLFNQKMALGLGAGIDLLKLANGKQSLSLFYIVNFSPVQRLDVDYYANYKFLEGYPNKIDLNNYVTYNELNITHFIGLYLSLF